MDRINARSPYFLQAPVNTGMQIINPESVLFELSVWTGDIVIDKPVTPTYSYTKLPRFSGDRNIYIDVSEQILDFIEHTYNGVLDHSCVFVYYNIVTTYSSGTIVSNDTLLAFDGYSSHFEGVNFHGQTDILINNRYIFVKDGETLTLPFFTNGDNYTIEFREGTSVGNTESVVSTPITTTNGAVINISDTATGFDNIRVLNTDTLDEFVIDVNIVDECKFDPVKCVFINKFGAKQEFWFFKSYKETIKTKDSNYRSNVLVEGLDGSGNPNLSYDTSRPLTTIYNKQSNKSITVNTGNLKEDSNIVIEEMMNSKNIWIVFDGQIRAVTISEKSKQLLSRKVDKMVQYSITFEYAYDEIQNVR